MNLHIGDFRIQGVDGIGQGILDLTRCDDVADWHLASLLLVGALDGIQVLANTDTTFHDVVEGVVMDAIRNLSNEAGLKETYGTSEALAAGSDDVAGWHLASLLLVGVLDGFQVLANTDIAFHDVLEGGDLDAIRNLSDEGGPEPFRRKECTASA